MSNTRPERRENSRSLIQDISQSCGGNNQTAAQNDLLHGPGQCQTLNGLKPHKGSEARLSPTWTPHNASLHVDYACNVIAKQIAKEMHT